MISIGPYQSFNTLFLAPMAGVTDLPFRRLCKKHGAGWVVSEMVWSHKHLYETTKTQKRIDHGDEIEPKIAQIAGGDAELLAESARFNVEKGAQIIDINMGCPAKKVCNKLAGSALMKDEKLVAKILNAVVNAVNIPVTLKIRTGWHYTQKNALSIAKIAEEAGISLLTIHGRAREQKYMGNAEYDTIATIKDQLSIPIVANGDINCPEKAKHVLDYTKADGLMIGRSAHGNPWLFSQIHDYLTTNSYKSTPSLQQQKPVILEHIEDIHQFYGDYMGLRFARKHVNWYFAQLGFEGTKRKTFNKIQRTQDQLKYLSQL